MGNGFLRSKADKGGMDGLIVFIPELLSVSRRENVISIDVEEEDQNKAQVASLNLAW